MNNFWNKTNTILSVIAILVAIFIGWYFNREKSTSLNIEQVNATKLSPNLDIEGLTVQYLFHDSIEVNNLWKTIFTIKNTGDQSLYGKGFSDINVKDGVLQLIVKDCKKLLSIKMTNNNNGCILSNNGGLIITQWKPNEYAEFEILTESETAPSLTINPRDIKDATITYSKYTPSTISTTPKLIDKFPSSLRNILKWVIVVIMALLILMAVVQMPQQLKDKPNFVRVFTIILWMVFMALTLSPLLWVF